MAAAEQPPVPESLLPYMGEAPEGMHWEVLAPGTTGEIPILVRDELPAEPEPILHEGIEPDLHDLDAAAQIVFDTVAQRAAQRRLDKRGKESKLPKHLREVPVGATQGTKNPREIPQPFARGIGTRPTPQEIEKAAAVLAFHSRQINSRNKRTIGRSAF